VVQTRKARKNDAKSIIKLLIELGRPIPKKNEIRHFSNVVNHYITDSDKSMFVALDDSKIVGMVSIIFLPRLNQNREEAWIPDLIINKKYQKHGIGTSLLKKCLASQRKRIVIVLDWSQDYQEKLLTSFTKISKSNLLHYRLKRESS